MFKPVLGNCLLIGATLNLFMISEEHWENDEILFQIVYAHREPVTLWIRGMLITYCVCDFLIYGYPCMKKEDMMSFRERLRTHKVFTKYQCLYLNYPYNHMFWMCIRSASVRRF